MKNYSFEKYLNKRLNEDQVHPELLALVKSMMDSRWEHTPRLVGADWLEENGDEELAHFIRASYNSDDDPANYQTYSKLYPKILERLGVKNNGNQLCNKNGCYHLQGHGLFATNKDGNNKTVDLNQTDENTLKILIFLLAQSMFANKIHKNSESSRELEQCYYHLSVVLNTIAGTGWAERDEQSVSHVLDRLLSTLKDDLPKSRMTSDIFHYLERLKELTQNATLPTKTKLNLVLSKFNEIMNKKPQL